MTVADAKWLNDRLKDAPEAKNQIAFADVILLNKTDLVTPEELSEVEARIRGINPYAKLHRTERAKIALDRGARPQRLRSRPYPRDRAGIPRAATITTITTTTIMITATIMTTTMITSTRTAG